jgi:hypothetical protein
MNSRIHQPKCGGSIIPRLSARFYSKPPEVGPLPRQGDELLRWLMPLPQIKHVDEHFESELKAI